MNLETLRQRLVRECPDFNTVDAFRLLDDQGSGEVSTKQLRKALSNEIKVSNYSEEKLALFFGRFDKGKRISA